MELDTNAAQAGCFVMPDLKSCVIELMVASAKHTPLGVPVLPEV